MAELKLTQEELEAKLKELEELKAANAAKAQTEGSSGDKTDDGKKPGFFTKIKDGAVKAINHKFSIKDVVIAAGVVTAGVLGIKYAYDRGLADGRSESEFEGTVALPDGDCQLALEAKADAQEVFNATISDLAENFEVESVEEL